VRTVRLGALLGTLVTLVLLGVLSLATGLSVAGWIVGLAAGWTTTALLVAGRARREPPGILPPDWVTLTRALVIAGVAGLVADSFTRSTQVTAIVVLASIALALDAVDGQVARRTGTETPFGARLDGEVDAFLILLLSVEVARDYGDWVLAIGALRYAFLVAGWALPWLAAPLPSSYWRRLAATLQGVVLTIVASGVVPRAFGMVLLGIALVVLAASFGQCVVWLYRAGAGPVTRRVLRRLTAVGAGVVVWGALVAPDRLELLTPAAFLRIPVEGLVLVAIALLLPARPRRIVAIVAGVLFGLLAVFKVFDVVLYQEFARPFNPVLDWGNVGPAIGVVRDSIGTFATGVALVIVLLGLALVVALVTVAAVRLTSATARHRRNSAGGIAVLGLVAAVAATLSIQINPGQPLASTGTARLAASQVHDAETTMRDQQQFENTIHASDPYASIPTSQLLTGLRGKDVVIAFVESYGQVAVQGTSFSPGVDAVLRSGTTALTRAGYQTRSAFLTSPTFGGISWLAHSTLQSGLWVDNQQRYNQLVASNRFTLSRAFKQAGWRTVSDVPSDDYAWASGTSFYHYDKRYDRRNVGYHGPTFSYASVPDQFTLAAFQRLELQPGHSSVMAEIDLVSSHTPWTPQPRMVSWDQLGDGSIFNPMPAQGLAPSVAWGNASTVQALYGQSIQYSMTALIQWITRLHDPNLVVIALGDHQPATTVSGAGANHEVPISIITPDPKVIADVASWNWQSGLLPGPNAPVGSMDAFRNRFLSAFSSTSQPPVALAPPR
jgi:phosphatidylglycerophosphate synthase